MTNNKNSFKEDFMKHPLGYSLTFTALFVLAVVILWLNLGSFSAIWPTSKNISEKRKELTEAQKELQEKLDELDKLKKDQESFIRNNKNFWISERDGDPKVNLQKKITATAANQELTLSSVGAVRADKIVDGVYLMNVSVRGEGSLQSVVKFLGELQSMKPDFYWQSILIRPKSHRDPDMIILTGSVQVLAIDDPKLTKLLLK